MTIGGKLIYPEFLFSIYNNNILWENRALILSNINHIDLLSIQNDYGWKFTKDISSPEDAKIFLYLYYKNLDSKLFFNLETIKLKDLNSVNVILDINENNLNNVFFNIYTVGSLNNWYENKYDLLLNDNNITTIKGNYNYTLNFDQFKTINNNIDLNQEILGIVFSSNSIANPIEFTMYGLYFKLNNFTYSWTLNPPSQL
jgi:hypothetical protein